MIPRNTIYTQGWQDDRPANAEEATAQVECRVFMDGQELEGIISATPSFFARDFATVELKLHAYVEIVTCGNAEWKEIDELEGAR